MTRVSLDQLVFLVLLLQIPHFAFCLQNITLSCKINEKKALLQLKEHLIDPTGRLCSWDGGDYCRWCGISCSDTTGNVIKLDLYARAEDQTLSGEINPSLLQLKSLSHLDVSMNNFEGTTQIPNFLSSLRELTHLNLSSASFGGRIPSNLGNLSGLQQLDLSSYTVEPVENGLQWLSGLSSLEYLNLGGLDLHTASSYWLNTLPSLLELHLPQCQLVNLPKSLPSVNFTSLFLLDLSGNGFNSALPNWLFNLTKLKILDLNSNNLEGTLPDALSGLTSLENMDLSSNYGIEGPLRKGLGTLHNLRKLSLAMNNFTGPITEFIDGLSECTSSSLETMDLGNNGFGSTLPPSLGLLNCLRYLYLWHNFFTGPLTQTIGNFLLLQHLYLSNNEMTGSIPESLGQLRSLVVLDISENSWEGFVMETHLANLTSLTHVVIGRFSSNVSLILNISSSWSPPFKLTYVKIQGCRFSPNFPTFLRNQSDLERVIINNAEISDVIPDWFFKMDLQLLELDVAYIQLHAKVPNFLRFQPRSNVDLRSNNFEGPLPLWSV